jgi:PAP2 superfamily
MRFVVAAFSAMLLRGFSPISDQPLIWVIPGILLVIDVAWGSQVGLLVGGIGLSAGAIIVLLAMSVIYRHRSRALADMAAATASWGALTSTGVVLNYLAASCALPLQDEMMERLDRVLGFDWLAWRDAMLGRSTLSWLLAIAYYSLQPQAALSIIYFTVSGRTARIRELLLLAGVTLAAAVIISAIWPVLGPFAKHGGGDVAYLPDVLALRAGGPWHFNLFAMQGIITMPSYHTVMAVLFTYAFRGTGPIGYGIAALNMLMLLSIPPIGGHYLVDMLAGGALALVAIAGQRAPRHGVSRILIGLWREPLVGKVLDSERGSVFKPERISARALAAKAST